MSEGAVGGVMKGFWAILFELQPCRLKDIKSTTRVLLQSSIQILHAFKELLDTIFTECKFFWSFVTLKSILISIAWIGGLGIFYSMNAEMLWVILSLFILIFFNLGERKDGELSAYSVFNVGVKRLLGTMTAEQFEQEIRHQPLHNAQQQQGEEEEEFGDIDVNGRNNAPIQRHVRGKKARRTYEARIERRRLEQEMDAFEM